MSAVRILKPASMRAAANQTAAKNRPLFGHIAGPPVFLFTGTTWSARGDTVIRSRVMRVDRKRISYLLGDARQD